jgi:inorganic pyrophosphatase
MPHILGQIPPFDGDDCLTAVVEATRGSRNKFKYDLTHGVFVLNGVLPAGSSFPFDFGFVPSTRGEDGDPLDVLILMDEPAFVGAVVPCRLIGAIEAEQSEPDQEPERNDRLLAVASKSRSHRDVQSIADLPTQLVEEIEHFWISYNEIKGKRFTPIGRADADAARKLVRAGRVKRRRR